MQEISKTMLRIFLSHDITHQNHTLLGLYQSSILLYLELRLWEAVSIHTLYTPPRAGCFYTYLIYSTEGRLFLYIPYTLHRGQAVSIHTLYTPPRAGCFYTYLIYSTEGMLFLYIPYILHQGQAVSIHTL